MIMQAEAPKTYRQGSKPKFRTSNRSMLNFSAGKAYLALSEIIEDLCSDTGLSDGRDVTLSKNHYRVQEQRPGRTVYLTKQSPVLYINAVRFKGGLVLGKGIDVSSEDIEAQTSNLSLVSEGDIEALANHYPLVRRPQDRVHERKGRLSIPFRLDNERFVKERLNEMN